mmetsp:Transcript_24395/g.60210  ORF Transcript_24395/g.60210 Transcript_24395/m.60210 type:complete len:296 (+) Transcript_24395:349-1236(+)
MLLHGCHHCGRGNAGISWGAAWGLGDAASYWPRTGGRGEPVASDGDTEGAASWSAVVCVASMGWGGGDEVSVGSSSTAWCHLANSVRSTSSLKLNLIICRYLSWLIGWLRTSDATQSGEFKARRRYPSKVNAGASRLVWGRLAGARVARYVLHGGLASLAPLGLAFFFPWAAFTSLRSLSITDSPSTLAVLSSDLSVCGMGRLSTWAVVLVVSVMAVPLLRGCGVCCCCVLLAVGVRRVVRRLTIVGAMLLARLGASSVRSISSSFGVGKRVSSCVDRWRMASMAFRNCSSGTSR